VKTDIEYLTLLDKDLLQAARREKWLKAAPPVRRRGWDIGWGPIAAAAVGLLVVAGLIGLIATNGGLDNAGNGGGKAVADLGASGATGAAELAGLDARDPLASTTPAPVQSGPSEQVGDVSKIIRDGTISIQVANNGFSDAFGAVTRIAGNNGGFVLSSQIRGQRAGTLTLRIPAKRFDEAMLALRDVGVVQAQSITGKDVTAEFIDLRARLENAIGQRTVLRNLMARATTIRETITVQSHLSRVELQIEQIQGQLNVIENQVAEATVRVDLHEKDAAQQPQTTNVENPSLGSAWDRAIQGFLNVVAAVVVGLGYLIPLGILALAVWLVTLAVRRRRAAS
jgi:hypothetical protein